MIFLLATPLQSMRATKNHHDQEQKEFGALPRAILCGALDHQQLRLVCSGRLAPVGAPKLGMHPPPLKPPLHLILQSYAYIIPAIPGTQATSALDQQPA
jgi:hypothetical protein